MIRHALSFLGASLAVTASVHGADAAPDSGLIVLPPIVDLGIVAPGEKTTVTAWLVNASLAPIDVASCKPACGCTVVDRFPQRLEPGAARAVTYTITAGRKPDTPKTATIRLTPGWGAPVTLTTKMRTAPSDLEVGTRGVGDSGEIRRVGAGTDATAREGGATDATAATGATAREGGATVQLVTITDDLGEVVAGRPLDTTAWIVNPTRQSVRVERVKAGCGCTKVVGFEPVDVAPDSATRLRLRITPSAKKDGDREVTLTAYLAGSPAPLTTALRMSVVEAIEDEPVRVSGR